MRVIPTYVHGIVDYLGGLLLIAAPWLFGFAADGAETWVPVAAGCIMLIGAVFTDYEAGLIRQIPMSAHLAVDAVVGLVLAASPWIFGFAELVWVPHLVLGLAEFAGAMMTQTHPTHRTAVGPR